MSLDWASLEGHVIIGVYPLNRWLGSSDHSGVFLTQSAKRTPAEVALKLVPVDSALAESQLSRWVAAAGLSHPHLLRIHEAGHREIDGLPYQYALMEYADQNLAQLLAHRALAESEAREMLVPVLSALAFLHDRKLVQGALKPSNVLVVGDQLKLATDTVRPVGAAGGEMNALSAYDPPEARDGARSTAGDIWALGVTLCEALVRRQPSVLNSGGEVVLPLDLPEAFRELVARCLSRRPEDRPGAAHVQAWLRGEPLGRVAAASAQRAAIASPEPVRTRSARPESAMPAAARSAPPVLEPAQRQPTKPEPANPEPATPQLAKPEPANPEPATPQLAKPEPANLDLTKPQPTKPYPAKSATVVARPVATVPAASATAAPAAPASAKSQEKIKLVIRAEVLPEGEWSAAARQPAKKWHALPLILGAVAVAALIWGGVWMFGTDGASVPTADQAVGELDSSAQQASASTPSSTLVPAPASPSVSGTSSSESTPGVRASSSSQQPAASTAGPESAEPEGDASVSALNEVLPEVPRRARQTIRGTVRVSVRVIVDPEGTVFAALADNSGPSRYFERLAIDAAKKWIFEPAQTDGQRLMLVRFSFTRDGTTARAVPVR